MDEVKETLAQMKDEEKQKFIYEVHKSANSNALQNPMALAIAAAVCKETGVKFIKDINNYATHHCTILMDKEDMYLPALQLGKKITKEAFNAVVNFVNCEKELRDYDIRLFDIHVQYDLEFAMVQVDVDYVRDLKDE